MTGSSEEKMGLTRMSQATYIVALGASAGGLEVLEKLFKRMPVDSGMAFVVIQHLSPNFDSMMDELLQRCTSMPVSEVGSDTECEANHVYLISPNKEIIMQGNYIVPRARPVDQPLNLPINVFLQSLAKEWTEKAVAIILSGTGSDGSLGIQDIQQNGGVVIVQHPESARFDGMPRNAIATGWVDAVLQPEDIPQALSALANNPGFFESGASKTSAEKAGLKSIFEGLKSKYLIDFSQYKPSTINRRIHRRIAFQGGKQNIGQYAEELKTNLEESSALYRDLLIGVTQFFRDEQAFDALQNGALHQLIDQVEPGEEFRVWVCGCSTGEEAYTVTMIILDEMAKLGRSLSLKVFATDLHPDSLRMASEGVYSEDRLASVPETFRQRYFMPAGHHEYRVTQALRRHIIFSEHNLLKDPPFTKVHLITCRNLLIYLQPEVQAPVLRSFNFALHRDGLLMLGSSETLGPIADDFEVIERRWKIYRKKKNSLSREGMRPLQISHRLGSVESSSRYRDDRSASMRRLYNTLLERYIPTGFLLNEYDELLHVFGDAQQFLSAPNGAVTGEVFSLLSDNLAIALNSALKVLKSEPEKLAYQGTFNSKNGAALEIRVETLTDLVNRERFYMVILKPQNLVSDDNTDFSEIIDFSLPEETAKLVRQLQQELIHSKVALQENAEELEASNEELQASNEELLASNEELQSTNEELHSVNEELYTVNTEHENKILELDKLSKELSHLVDSTKASLIFVDDAFKIKTFTPKAVEVYSLVNSDIGRDIRTFMPVFDDPSLADDLEYVRTTGKPKEALLRNHVKGSTDIRFLKRLCRLYSKEYISDQGIIISYQDVTREQAQEMQNEMLFSFINESEQALITLDTFLKITFMSARVCELLELKEGSWHGHEIFKALAASPKIDPNKFKGAVQIKILSDLNVDKYQFAYRPWTNTIHRGWIITLTEQPTS